MQGMTEEEAKTKWCPAADNSKCDRYAEMKTFDSAPENCCIASDCMAWRQIKKPTTNTLNDNYDGTGYCGLTR